MEKIPPFYDRYKGKFPNIISVLNIINGIALKRGLGELYLNGFGIPGNFGGYDECRQVQTYQVSATNRSIKINSNTPMFIEIEHGYNYQLDGNPNYFINFRVQTELLHKQYDKFMSFFDECFYTLTGTNYNLVLTEKWDSYINLVYVPEEVNYKGGKPALAVRTGDEVSHKPIIWLIGILPNNFTGRGHIFYQVGLPQSSFDDLTDEEKALIKKTPVSSPPDPTIIELLKKLITRLDESKLQIRRH